MSESEEFKNSLDIFLRDLSLKICDTSILNNIQLQYNHLMDLYGKLSFMSKDELDSIDNDMANYEKEIERLQILNHQLSMEKEILKKKFDELNESAKKSEIQKEGLLQKIEILQNTLDDTSLKTGNHDATISKLEQTISDMKNDYSTLQMKYQVILDEIEIHKRNVKKNFNLEREIKELTEENEKLCAQIKISGNFEDYKIKYFAAQSELKELNEKNSMMLLSLEKIKNENESLKEDNLDQMSIIVNLQSEKKIKSHKIEENENEKKKMKKIIDDLSDKVKEAEYSVSTCKKISDNQARELKKEIDKLVKNCETLKKANQELREKLSSFQHYTNFAKASKENLSKKDFSILETMSRRVEEAESLNGNLKQIIDDLGNENAELKVKLSSFENVVLLYMKDDIDLTRRCLNEIPEEEIEKINRIKNNPQNLIDHCIFLKKENFCMRKEIEEITIECNKKLRSSILKGVNEESVDMTCDKANEK